MGNTAESVVYIEIRIPAVDLKYLNGLRTVVLINGI